MNSIQRKLISVVLPALVEQAISSFPKVRVRLYLDSLIDEVEERIISTDTEMDDALLPLLVFIREVFEIPDNDDPQRPG
jgi:hypothetical protein